MHEYKKQRLDILKQLYAALQGAASPRFAWVKMHALKDVVGDCDVAIFYLTDKGWIRADGNQFQITASGMDVVEASEIG